MKFEEKRKKNKNCEISHIVRPAVTLVVYNQKQNTLLTSECVEHRMFKVTWARLCVYSDRRAVRWFEVHGLVVLRVYMDASTVRLRMG